MAATIPTPQRPAQPHAPQPVPEKVPIQSQQGFHFVPYPNGQQSQLPFRLPATAAEEIPFSRPWHLAKIVLGSASLVASIVMWAIGIVIVARYISPSYGYIPFHVTFEVAFALSAAGIAIIWQAAEFITIWASKAGHGIHPGANVALHLIIWLVAILAVGFFATFVAFDSEDLNDIRTSNYSADSYDDSYDYDSNSLATLLRLEETLLAFASVLLLLHFVLFVRACVETHHFNRQPATRTVYVQVPMQFSGATTGQQPYGFYTYQTLPVQQLPPPQPQQVQGTPISPQQAHLYGYYAPAPGLSPPALENNRASTVPGPSNPTIGHHSPPARTVSPMTIGDRQ